MFYKNPANFEQNTGNFIFFKIYIIDDYIFTVKMYFKYMK